MKMIKVELPPKIIGNLLVKAYCNFFKTIKQACKKIRVIHIICHLDVQLTFFFQLTCLF